MTHSFFPKSDADLTVWASNYKQKIIANAAVLGLTSEQADAEVEYCEGLITAINAVNNQKQALKAAINAKNIAIQAQGGALRIEIARHKIAKEYTDAIGQDLGIIGTHADFDSANYKAKITVELFGGFVRIKFTKKGADGINIYHRKKGSPNWLFMARVTKSPFDDHITLEQPGQPEHWEYRAYGIIDDNEIGVASDIVETVFGG